MSALMRKQPLDEVGGLESFADYLAEDFFFAKSLTDRGWKLRISSQPAWQNTGISDIDTFQSRVSRFVLHFSLSRQVAFSYFSNVLVD
jgi:ceramide glucosyltransferase